MYKELKERYDSKTLRVLGYNVSELTAEQLVFVRDYFKQDRYKESYCNAWLNILKHHSQTLSRTAIFKQYEDGDLKICGETVQHIAFKTLSYYTDSLNSTCFNSGVMLEVLGIELDKRKASLLVDYLNSELFWHIGLEKVLVQNLAHKHLTDFVKTVSIRTSYTSFWVDIFERESARRNAIVEECNKIARMKTLYKFDQLTVDGEVVQEASLKTLDSGVKKLSYSSGKYNNAFKEILEQEIQIKMQKMLTAYNSKTLYWPSSTGPKLVQDMDDLHIKNSRNMLKTKKSFDSIWRDIFDMEVNKREIKLAQKRVLKSAFIDEEFMRKYQGCYDDVILQDASIDLLKDILKQLSTSVSMFSTLIKEIISIELKERISKMNQDELNDILYFLRNHYPNHELITYAVGTVAHVAAEANRQSKKVLRFSERYGYVKKVSDAEILSNTLEKYVDNYSILETVFDKYLELQDRTNLPFELVKWEMTSSIFAPRDFDTCSTPIGEVAAYKTADGYDMIKIMKRRGISNPFIAMFKHPHGGTVRRLVLEEYKM